MMNNYPLESLQMNRELSDLDNLNYFDAKEVMELHIFHFESVREKLFNVIDICCVLTSND